MPLKSINNNPSAARKIGELLHQQGKNLTVVDIGARSGASTYWNSLGEALHIIGFEPDLEECAVLNKTAADTNSVFYPYAVHETTGSRDFYITKTPNACGFDPIEPEFCRRFQTLILRNSVDRVVRLDTVSIDDFVKNNQTGDLSFLKIDVEGTELSVLKGAENALRDKRVLGVEVEVWWENGIKKTPAFAEMDIYLRSQGFHFFDVAMNYLPRGTMPAGSLSMAKDPANSKRTIWSSSELRGQAMTGDALYFRDPIREMTSGPSHIQWDDETILKLVALFDIFNYADCGIELLDFYRSRFTIDVNLEELYDLFVSGVNGFEGNYSDFHDMSKALLEQSLLEGGLAGDLSYLKKPLYDNSRSIQRKNSELSQDGTEFPLDSVGLQSKEQTNQRLQEEINFLRYQNSKLRDQITSIFTSKSWRAAKRLSSAYQYLKAMKPSQNFGIKKSD